METLFLTPVWHNAYRIMFRWTYLGLTVGLFAFSGCSEERYKAMETRLSPLTMRDDQMHQLRLQDALTANPEFAGLTLATYVFMDRGYVIGHVNSPQQAEAVFQTARNVKGLRSVDAFLPVKRIPSGESTVENVTSDAQIKAQIESSLVLTPGVVYTRVHVEVLDSRVVLVGVVSGNEEKVRAEGAASKTSGVNRVINWLVLPDTEYMSIGSQVF